VNLSQHTLVPERRCDQSTTVLSSSKDVSTIKHVDVEYLAAWSREFTQIWWSGTCCEYLL